MVIVLQSSLVKSLFLFVRNNILLIITILFYLVNGVFYLRAQSSTNDENSFYDYAKRYLKGNPERIYPIRDNSKTPVIVLNTIPRITEQLFNPNLKKNDYGISDLIAGRYVTLFISVFSILLVYAWASQLYGKTAGIFSAVLTAFCPNILAHSGLVTTDSYSMLCLLFSMYSLWKFCEKKTFGSFIIFSMAVGISQLVKQSLFHLYVLAPLMLLSYFIIFKYSFRPIRVFKYLFVFIAINWFIANAGYYFYKTNESLGDYHFLSNLFISVQKCLPAWLPVPAPKPFVDALDMTKYYEQIGGGIDHLSSGGKITILGKSRVGGGFWYYYFVTLFFKVPISDLIFFAWSFFVLCTASTQKDFFKKEFFLIAPVVYFLSLMSFFYNTQNGIRHIIFILPFLYILSSKILSTRTTTLKNISIGILIIFLMVSVLRYWENYLPYTNEFITDKKLAYKYVGADNLEFLQGKYFFEDYLKKHPEVHLATSKPMTGIFLINTSDYLDVWDRHEYDWLKNIRPVGQVAYNGLLIEVTGRDIKH